MSKDLKSQTFNTQWQESFEDIQCYQDEQVNEKLQALLNNDELLAIINELFSFGSSKAKIDFSLLKSIHNVEDFQAWVSEQLFPIIETTYESLSVSGLDNLDPLKAYVFISNHRDIVMDPLILNKALREHGFSTSNCAIGDNLLKHPAANDLALLNRCFKVFRSLKSPRAMLRAMKTQSEYIHYLHFGQESHIWIAQKEGRAKDNIDKTNPALLKMLGLAKPKDYPTHEYLNALNIVPVCFSYEWDPCDIDKARELNESESSGTYHKDRLDDFISTKKGISGSKGRIHIAFGEVLNVSDSQDHKDAAQMIDEQIHQAYRTYPINYACYKRIDANEMIDTPYSKQEIDHSSQLLDQRLEGETSDIQSRVCTAYSQVIHDKKKRHR